MSDNKNDFLETDDDIKDIRGIGDKSMSTDVEDIGESTAPKNKEGSTRHKKNENAGIYNHKFKKPFDYEGKKFTVLNFNFEKLTGRDMISIESEIQANGEMVFDPLLSRNFQCKLAARASGVSSDALEAMPVQEFRRITNAVRDFLLNSEY